MVTNAVPLPSASVIFPDARATLKFMREEKKWRHTRTLSPPFVVNTSNYE